MTHTSRSRWAAIGAAIAVTLGAGGIGITHATSDSGDGPVSAFFPIEPCRLAANEVILADSSATLDGWGATGNCNLPNDITGLAANVTAVNATQQTNLRFYAQGDAVPETANLNPTPGAPPTPNAVNIPLNIANGQFRVYNRFGSVGVFIDILGYYDDHTHDSRYYTEDEVDTALDAVDTALDAVDTALDAKSDLEVVTRLPYAGSNTEGSPTSNFELIRTVGTFTKQSADTVVRLDWNAHHSYVGTADSDFCHYQLRIDGAADNGDSGLPVTQQQGGNAITYSPRAPLSAMAYFQGLAAGDHTVAVYVRGNATSCTLNNGNFHQQLVVTEIDVASASDFATLGLTSAQLGAAQTSGK